MNKTLLSAAFLAASGGYVAYANHVLDALIAARPSDEATAAVMTKATTAPRPAASAQPAAAVTSSSSFQPVASAPAPAASPAAAAPTPSRTFVAAAPPAPQPAPKPLSRPATIASVQQTQSVAAAASNSGYRDGSYTGTDENAYYGRVQVQVTVARGQITGVKVLDYPNDRRTSRYINGQALPLLQQEVMQAQNAQIDTVSGATLTSEAYIRSLGNALQKAGGSNA